MEKACERMRYQYYEDYRSGRRRRRDRRRRGCLGWLIQGLLRLLLLAMVLASLAALGVYMLPTALFMVEPDAELSLTDGLPSSPFNILVLGVDVANDGGQRSDAMLIASIDRGELKLTSVQRDMLVELEGHGMQKINAAYAYGGAEMAMRAVNEAFDLNVMKYIVVDYKVVVQLVDAVGGIELNVAEDEVAHINSNVLGMRKVFQPLGYTATELTTFGENTHLDGLQALGYARIRKLDSDFVRTSRQRAVINATLSRLKDQIWNPVAVIRFVVAGVNGIETNLSELEIASLGSKALLAEEIDQLRLPVNGSFEDDGSALTIVDREANIEVFRNFVYGE